MNKYETVFIINPSVEDAGVKELIEKLHAKLMKVVDENCRGVDFRQLKLNKVSPKVFDLEVVIEGMVGSALFSANLPTKYSNMKIVYDNKSSQQIDYEGNTNCWRTRARMYLK